MLSIKLSPFAGALVLALTGASALAAQQTKTPVLTRVPPFKVTKVTAVVKPATVTTSKCPAHLTFTAMIVTNLTSGSVTYQWIRSDGGNGPKQTITVTGTSTQVTDTWDLGGKGDHKKVGEKLQVTAPNAITSTPAMATIVCN